MKDAFHQQIIIPDQSFPIIIDDNIYNETEGKVFNSHWHEQVELLFYIEGEAVIQCGNKSFSVKEGDLLVVNSNEIHYEESTSPRLRYFCIIIDMSLLRGSYIDTCNIKYLSPISNNYIYFKNKINGNSSVIYHVQSIIREFETKLVGFELAIKGHVCSLFVVLLREYVDKIANPNEFKRKAKNAEMLDHVLKYIEQNYSNNITLDQMAKMINISTSHFCHIFKETTGKTLGQYLNYIRINVAEKLLISSNDTVTEISYRVGFSDINYFSRIYKKYKGVSPSETRKRVFDS